MKVVAVLAFVVSAIITVFANGTYADPVAKSPYQTSYDGLILISTLDGFLMAVDATTGELKWRFKEVPLINSPHDAVNGFTFIPNPRDGELYSLDNSRLLRMPYTIPQLVKASPSRSTDGILFAGSKKDIWISINPETGTRTDTLPPPPSNSYCPVGHPKNVFIGRTEYQLSMLDTKNPNRNWNGTFTDYSSYLLPPEAEYPYYHFTLPNEGKIITVDAATDELLWMYDFAGVIVNLYLLKSDGLHLLPSYALGESMFNAYLGENELVSDVDFLKSIIRKPGTSYSPDEIEGLSMGRLVSSLYVDETPYGIYALSGIIDENSSSLASKTVGPVIVEVASDLQTADDVATTPPTTNIAMRPTVPRGLSAKATTMKVAGIEYLLLGWHLSPKIIQHIMLHVTDPTPLSLSSPSFTKYLTYKPSEDAGRHGGMISTHPRDDNKCSAGQTCPSRFKPPQRPVLPKSPPALGSLQDDEKWTLLEIAAALWDGYPLLTMMGSIFFIAFFIVTIYTFGRHSVALPASTIPYSSRDSSRGSGRWGTNMATSGRSNTSSLPGVDDWDDTDPDLPSGWRRVGRITFNPLEILGQGCEGTVVYRGKFDGRDAAVKRVISDLMSYVDREVDLLRESDTHPNVIRYFCSESDMAFRFLALELCDCSLKEYVHNSDVQTRFSAISKVEILRQATNGLAHLHDNNIVHRDVKPQNILLALTPTGKVRVLISDFGLSKKIQNGHASLSRVSGLAGTEGWIAPEIYDSTARITPLADVFSLGCVYFHVLSNGKHPFGDSVRRQSNILRGEYNLGELAVRETSFSIAAVNLIESMVQRERNHRPRLYVVLAHPMFWNEEKQLQFFMDVSDRIEKEDENNDVVQRLEMYNTRVAANWHNNICQHLFADLNQFRKYKHNSIRDLLRALRNKKHHYRELPEPVKASLGTIPNEYVAYWTSRFPRLLMHIYNAMICCAEESSFATYYPIEAHSFCNRRLESELNSDFIAPPGGGSPQRVPRPVPSCDSVSNWRQPISVHTPSSNAPISANAAKKRKKRKKAPISILATPSEEDAETQPAEDADDVAD